MLRWKWSLASFVICLPLLAQSASPPATAPAAPTTAPASSQAATTDLLSGAAWTVTMDGQDVASGPTFVVPPDKTVTFHARAEFQAAGLTANAMLELRHNVDRKHQAKVTLNGQGLTGPLEKMYYRTIPGIHPAILKDGANALVIEGTISNKAAPAAKGKEPAAAKALAVRLEASLLVLGPADLRISSGPMLTACGSDYFSLTCRTNLPALVRLGSQAGQSKDGLIHRFRVPPLLPAPFQPSYDLTAEYAGRRVATTVKPPAIVPASLRFVAVGDNRTNPKDWAKVAAAALQARPQLVVHTGDMVVDGPDDSVWDSQFFDPAAPLLAAAAVFGVIGNHERDCPLFDEMFYSPSEDGRGRNWSQQLGPVLLIGIDGLQDWSAEGANAAWLEKVLAGATAKYVFLASHYPAWSSSSHGKTDEAGMPKEKSALQAREVIMPLLAKYRATAMLGGHDHVYERSQPPSGVTMITTGGGGAPRYKQVEDPQKQNPHSQAFASELHYCLFQAGPDACTLEVYTPEGKLLDKFSWPPRK